MTGSRSAFALAVGRFATKLKQTDLVLAQDLSQFLYTENVMRGAGDFAPIPVDADSRMELVETIFPVQLDKRPLLDANTKAPLDLSTEVRSAGTAWVRKGRSRRAEE